MPRSRQHAETVMKSGEALPTALPEGFQWGFWVGGAIWPLCSRRVTLMRREQLEVGAPAAEAA